MKPPRPIPHKKYLSVRRECVHSEEIFETTDDETVIHVDDEEGDIYIYLIKQHAGPNEEQTVR